MLEDLIGYRLIDISDSGFKVEKDGNIRTFEFDEDYGDCCGYNEISTNLLIDLSNKDNLPVITEVKQTQLIKGMFDYCNRITITFMGEYKPIAEINSESGSGSGWNYGAHAWVKCIETGEVEELTSW